MKFILQPQMKLGPVNHILILKGTDWFLCKTRDIRNFSLSWLLDWLFEVGRRKSGWENVWPVDRGVIRGGKGKLLGKTVEKPSKVGFIEHQRVGSGRTARSTCLI